MALFADILHEVSKVKDIGLVKGESERVTVFESMTPSSLTMHALRFVGASGERREGFHRESRDHREGTAALLRGGVGGHRKASVEGIFKRAI